MVARDAAPVRGRASARPASRPRPRGRAFDRISQGVLFVLHATPEFWVATMALIYLASEAHWHVFPVGGLLIPPWPSRSRSRPASGLLADGPARRRAPPRAPGARARLPGVGRRRAARARRRASRRSGRDSSPPPARAASRGAASCFVHVLRSCAPPVITLFTSVLPGLVTGSILVEVLFSLDGMGRLSWQAATGARLPGRNGGSSRSSRS